MSRQGIKRSALYSSALIIAFLLLSPYILDWVMNSSLIKKEISQLIQQKTGVIIFPEKMDFTFLPLPGIHLKELEFSFNKAVQLDVKSVTIDLDPLKLLKGKIIVSKIIVETPDIHYTPGKQKDVSDPGKKPFPFKLPREDIQKLFSFFPDNQGNLNISIKNATSDYFESLNGSLVIDKPNNSLTMNARVHGLNIQKNQLNKNSLLKKINLDSISSKEIILDLKLIDARELIGNIKILEPQILSVKIPNNPLTADLFNLGFTFSNEILSAQIKPFVITYPKARVAIDFSNNKTIGKTAITFIGNDIDISQARQACLKLMGSNKIINQLFDILRGGISKEVIVGFKSNALANLFDGKNLFLKGSTINSMVKIPETPLIAENVQGNAIIEKGILHIKAQKGNIDSTAIKKGTLDIDLLNHEDIPFSGEFNLHTDLSTLPGVLISLLPETLLAKELALVRQISGQADAVLKLGMASMQKELDINVQTQNLSIKGHYDRIPLPIIITNGMFGYKNNKITLGNFSGFLKTSSFENLNAIVDLTQTPNIDISSAQAKLKINELTPWLQSHEMVMDLISPVRPSSGKIIVKTAKIQGPILTPVKWNYDIKGSGENLNIGFVPSKSKKTDTPEDKTHIQAASGLFEANDRGISIHGLKAQVEDLTWLSYAIDPSWLNSIKLPLHVSGVSIENNKNEILLKGKLTSPSSSELFFDINGKNTKDLFPSTVTLKDKNLSNAMFTFNQNPSQSFLDFKGVLNTSTIEQLLIKGSFLHDQLISFTSGTPVKIYMDANANLHLELEKIDLDISKPLTPTFLKSRGQRFTFLGNNSIFLTSRELKYKNRTFTDIKTEVSFNKEKTDIHIRHGALCDLALTGKVEILHEGNQVKTDFSIQSLDMEDIADMISCLFKDNALIDGVYSFSSNFGGLGTSDIISNSQNGFLTMHAARGRIYKLTLLSRLLSVLNILKTPDITQKGFGYKTIDIQADIKDSVIHLKKAIIDGNDMTLIFSGWIDPLNDKLDLTCLVAPFKTIDTIIKHIPIVNTIMGRLTLFPAKATGKISDPVVIPLHPSAVGQGLVNMLENIIKAPIRILEGTQ